jgi:putative SOS response-associated peptidase YedK
VITRRTEGASWHHALGFPEFPGERGVWTNVRNPKSAPWRGKLEIASRCIVPVDAFCEYQDGPSPKPKDGSADQTGSRSFSPGHGCRGGRTRHQESVVVGQHELFTFLTTSANSVVKPVHAKAMPPAADGR